MIPYTLLAFPSVAMLSWAILNFTGVSSRQPSPLYELLNLTEERAENLSL